MKREDRYIVIKRIDLEAAQAAGHVGNIEIAALNYIETCVDRMRFEREKQPLKCIVVESDWPEYEHVWELIRLRVENAEIPAETVQGVVDAPAVDAALRAFTDDATNDNAFFLVRAIMEARLPREPKTFDSVKEGLAATKSGDTFTVGKPTFGPSDR
mgnify:CR=1 FL=1|nr:MAG TPA_asm: hypothetical protein [Caudoviricetes sp.]